VRHRADVAVALTRCAVAVTAGRTIAGW
jgi:hypothetical protein